MVANNSIEINVRQNAGVGITYGIDAKLDEELNQDVKLNASTWNSIMTVVKNDQGDTKQYSGEDTDINNGSHFVVKNETFTITQNAWTQIVNIAKEFLGISASNAEAEEVQTGLETPVPQSSKEKVLELLKSKNITNLDNATTEELVERYEQILANDSETSDEIMAMRLSNYVKGKVNHGLTNNWDGQVSELWVTARAGNIENPDFSSALNSGVQESDRIDLTGEEGYISKDKLVALSNAYLEYMDSNNDKQIDLVELYERDLASYYQAQENITIEQARSKAKAKITELGLNSTEAVLAYIDSINLQSATAEQVTLVGTAMMFNKLNINTEDGNGLDQKEIMAYYAAMANFYSNDNKLDIADYNAFNESITSDVYTTVEGEQVLKNDYYLKGYYEAFKDINLAE